MSPDVETKAAPCFSDEKLSAAALRTFFNIAEQWKLNDHQQILLLGSPSEPVFQQWKESKDAVLSRDTLERISYILGIYKALHIIFSNDSAADGWVVRPNAAPLFGGGSALARMLSGNVGDLFVVRQYLDAQRGGWA
jgi:hypothetical protein